MGVNNYTQILDHVLNCWIKMDNDYSTNKGYLGAKLAVKKVMVELFK